MAINFIKKEDLSHITRTTRQWETTIDRYEIIPKGVLCIELCNDKLTKIKIGNGHLIYEQLPYVSDVNLSDYYTKEETNTLLKNLKSIKIKGEASSLSDLPLRGNEDGDLWFVAKQDPDEHNRYDEYVWYKDKWELFGSSDIDLSEYAKKSYVDTHIQEVQDEITEIIESGYLHKHDNKNILDQTSAVYTVEKDNKLRDLHNYDDTELREKAHTHLNKNILDQTDAVYNRDKDDKLASLHNYDDTSVKDRISTLESVAHSHSNQEILDRTTAAFTKEQALILLDCKDFEGTDGVHDGHHGFVPAPTKNDIGKVLGANGQWVAGGGGGGDTITEGGGINITTDPQTYEKIVSVNAGTGLEIDPQTGELYVTGGSGGDSITEGGGISITTDPQTGVKTISVNTGDHLEVDENTGELNVTDVDYEAGQGIHIGADYTLIEYIKNSGNYDQIILTDIIPNFSDKIEIDMKIGAAVANTVWDKPIFGCSGSTPSSYRYSTNLYLASNDSNISCYNHFTYESGNTGSNFFIRPSGVSYDGTNAQRQTLTMSGSTATLGNVSKNFSNEINNSFIDPQIGIAIFGNISDAGTKNYFNQCNLTIYGVKLYDSNNTLLHDLRPAERGADGEAGLYDLVTHKFYGNVGNGSFVKGQPVSSVDDRLISAKIGNGLQFDSNDAIEVNTGDGLSINQDNELDINTGDGLSINNNNEIELDKATTTTIGGVIVGDNLSIDNDGTLSADEYTPGEGISIDSNKEVSVKYNSDGLSINDSDELELDKATKNSIGGVIVGDNIDVTDGTISVPIATDSSLGVVNPTDGLSIDNNGELSVNIGTGLEFDQVTGAINVIGGSGGDTVEAGDGIDITTDSQTGNKVISTIVQENGGLTIDEDTNGLKLDQSAAGKAINISDEITFDSWNNGTGWANEEYYDNTSNTHIPWGQNLMIYPTSTDVLFRIPDGVTQAKCSATSVNPSIALKTGLYFYNEQGVHFAGPTRSTDPDTIIDIPAGSVYVNQSIRKVNDRDIFSSNVVGATITWVTGGTKIDVKYGTGLTLNQDNELEVNIGDGLEIDPDTGAINVTGGGGGGDTIAEGDGISITDDLQTGDKIISVNYGTGLTIDTETGALIVDGQLPEGTIIRKMTIMGDGGATNNIQFEKKPVAIMSIYGTGLGGNHISSTSAPIDSPILMGAYGAGGSSSGGIVSCAMSYNDSTNVLSLTGGPDAGARYNMANETYTVYYLTKGHTGEGTSETNEVSVIKTITYTGTGTATNTLQFPETPDFILSVNGMDGLSGDMEVLPFDPLHPTSASQYTYTYTSNGTPAGGNNSVGHGHGTYAFDTTTNTLTLTAIDQGAACNYLNRVYRLRYTINETISGGGGSGDSIDEGDGITITDDPITDHKIISVNVGEGLAIDPVTGALKVDTQLPEGTILKKLTYMGNGSTSANNIQFSKKPLAIMSIYGSSGTNYIASNPAPIDAPYLIGDYGGVNTNNTCNCAMSYNDTTNVLTLSPGYASSGDAGLLYNANGQTYTVWYLVKGHAGSGTSVNNEVSVVKTFSYVGTGTATNDIQFPETPNMVLSIYGPLGTGGNEIRTLAIDTTYPSTNSEYFYEYWQNGSAHINVGTYSFNDTTNILSLVGIDYGASLNYSGLTYQVHYIVNEVIASSNYVEGDGIEIDPDTGEISVNIGTGLAFDPQTGAINVTGGGGGGDTVAQGAGIEITTDQQTGNKVIAVNAGTGLQVNQTTNELEVSSGVVTSISPTQNTPGSITVTEGDGTATPVSVISQMGGATSSTAGTAGYVPAPATGDDDAYLRGDGTWDDSVLTDDDELTLVFVPDDYQPS